jgi:AcrR family transcriptional regulator
MMEPLLYNSSATIRSMPKVVDVDERRNELTDAAARVIARSGIEAATLRDVAAEAGLTTGALTHYFADKRELMLCTFQASLERRRSQRPTPVPAPDDARLALVASLEGALPLDDDRRRHWMVTIAFCSQAAGDDELAAAQRDAYREFRNHVTALVRRCGLASGRSAQQTAEHLIAVADGVAVQALFDPQSWSAARQRQALHAALTDAGLLGPP